MARPPMWTVIAGALMLLAILPLFELASDLG